LFDDPTKIHDKNSVGHEVDYPKIMNDEDVCKAKLLLQGAHQIKNLRLNRHVKRGHRLIRHYQLGFDCNRSRDSDPLALTSGELVRESSHLVLIQPDAAKRYDDPLALFGSGPHVMNCRPLGDGRADGKSGIERTIRILEYNLELSAHIEEFPTPNRGDVDAFHTYRSRRRLRQTKHGPAEGGLAAAGLTNHG